jgi:hypothetical protein
VSQHDATGMNAILTEAREHTVRLHQLAKKTRAEADEHLTQELIAEYKRFVESLEDAKAFWLEILQNSLEMRSRGGKS